HTSAEADRAAARIADREHDAIAEAIVVAGRRARAGLALALDDEPDLQQLHALGLGAADLFQQEIPRVRSIAEAEACSGVAGEAARFEVVPAALRIAQLLSIQLRSLLQRCEQTVRRGLLRSGALLARHFEADAGGEVFDRLDEAEVIVVHQEAE